MLSQNFSRVDLYDAKPSVFSHESESDYTLTLIGEPSVPPEQKPTVTLNSENRRESVKEVEEDLFFPINQTFSNHEHFSKSSIHCTENSEDFLPFGDIGDDEYSKPVNENNEKKKEKFRRWRHKEYQCDDCERMFTLKHNLQNHYVQYHMGCKKLRKPCLSCKCELCGKIYPSPSILADHMKEIHEFIMPGMIEKCETCGETFTSMRLLTKHVKKLHVEGKRCQFEQCKDLNFRFLKDLNEHMKKAHKNVTGHRFACSICDLPFKRLAAKIKHERNHMSFRLERVKNAREEEKEEEEAAAAVVADEQIQRQNISIMEKTKHEDDSLSLPSTSSMPSSTLKRMKTFQPELEAVAIKKRTVQKLSKDEILAKIK